MYPQRGGDADFQLFWKMFSNVIVNIFTRHNIKQESLYSYATAKIDVELSELYEQNAQHLGLKWTTTVARVVNGRHCSHSQSEVLWGLRPAILN